MVVQGLHGATDDRDEFKRLARKVTLIVMEKDQKRPREKRYSTADKNLSAIKTFVRDYAKRYVEKKGI